jgi:hypothetical protein
MIVENTFGRVLGIDTPPQELADSFGPNIGSSVWMGGRSDQMSLTRVRVEDIDPGTAATGEYILPTPLAGDDTGNGTPPLCALNIQWRGLAKGKNGRGRMYLPGFPASTAIAGFWTSDAQDPASAAASVIFDLWGPDGDNTLCIINRKSGGVALVPPTPTLITSFTIDNVVRRIGRREQGRGI